MQRISLLVIMAVRCTLPSILGYGFLGRRVSARISGQRGLKTWEQLAAYAVEEWYPSHIAFGKHKGKAIAARMIGGPAVSPRCGVRCSPRPSRLN